MTLSEKAEAWIAARPPAVAEKIRAYPWERPYRLVTTGQKVWLKSYLEKPDGTCTLCTIVALHADNPMTLNALLVPGDGVEVFDVPLANLVPWTDT